MPLSSLLLLLFVSLFSPFFYPFLYSSNLLVTILLICMHCIPWLLLQHIIDLHVDKLYPLCRFHSNTHTNQHVCEWAMALEEKLQPNEWVKACAQHDLKAIHSFGFFFLLSIFPKGPLRFFWLSLKIVNKASHFSSCVIEKLYNLNTLQLGYWDNHTKEIRGKKWKERKRRWRCDTYLVMITFVIFEHFKLRS